MSREHEILSSSIKKYISHSAFIINKYLFCGYEVMCDFLLFFLSTKRMSWKITLYLSLQLRSILWKRSVKNDWGFAKLKTALCLRKRKKSTFSSKLDMIVSKDCVWSIIPKPSFFFFFVLVILVKHKMLWKIISDVNYINFIFISIVNVCQKISKNNIF